MTQDNISDGEKSSRRVYIESIIDDASALIVFCRTEADIELIIDEEQISRWVNIWHNIIVVLNQFCLFSQKLVWTN